MGFVQEGVEFCDDENLDNRDECLNDCTFAYCGDGFTRAGLLPDDPDFEACDDGNQIDEDGCLNSL